MGNRNNQKKESKLKTILLKNAFPLFGFGALVWFLFRVVPKPSRAAYPCMKVAAPMASSFVLWIIGLTAAIFSFKKMKITFMNSSYLQAGLFLLVGTLFLIIGFSNNGIISFASTDSFSEKVTALNPIGEAKGINPGRVVWVWDPDATNENCTNKYYGTEKTPADTSDDGWFLNKNNNQFEIDKMLSESIRKLTGESTDYDAWEKTFKHFNEKRHNHSEGYTQGENVFIKINATSTWGKGKSWGNITSDNDHNRNDFYGMSETSPHLILSLLRQLIDTYGVQQENVFVGDPMKMLYNNSYNLWKNEFPNVHYISNDGDMGREKVIPTDNDIIIYSDKGNEMTDALSDKIYTVMDEADYLINVPTMKAHARAGVTLFAKNHFGSHTRNSAEHLHPGLVAIPEGVPSRTDSSLYRVQVDMMGHEKIGNNQVLFLLDALWAGSEAVEPPTKWDMAPFNNDWTSSIFVSQDMVAIESVAFDFLYSEYDGSVDSNYSIKVRHPHMAGTTDYLRQAASSDYWPDGIVYDPEGDGTPINSLGVNEHWNNPVDKQYTRNLGTGEGIELIFVNNSISNIETPSSLNAYVDENNIVELTWLDNSDNETGFIVERSEYNIDTAFVIIDTVAANQTTYIDSSEKNFSVYLYRIFAFNKNGISDFTQVVRVDIVVGVKNNIVIKEFKLMQNYPNPFNPTTSIKYSIPNVKRLGKSFYNVQLKVYDVLGKRVATLVNQKQISGTYEVNFNASNLASGTYIYKLQVGNFVESKKMILQQ